jgi:chain length determinant protein EpsF
MNITQFMTVLRARKRLALTWFFSLVAFSVVVTLVWPDHFRGDALVVVDVRPDPISGLIAEYGQTPSIVATQLDIINSDRVARRVVRDLNLTRDPDLRAKWQDDTDGKADIEEWTALLLQKHLDAKPSRESNVITISYTAPDPRFAAAVANAFMNAYLATLAELRVDPARGFASFFDRQVKDAHQAIEAAQAKLSEFQRSSGVTATDQRLDVETAKLNELAGQLVAMQTLASDTNSRQVQALSGKGDRLTDALNNPVIANLKFELDRSEANLQELNSRLGPKHPQVQQAQANVNELRAKLNAETSRVTGGVGVSAAVNQSRVAQVSAALEEERAKVLKLKQAHDTIDVLSQDVTNAQRNLDAITQRQSQTLLESQSQQNDVHALSPAVPPIKPAYPIMILNVLVGIFLGGIAAVVAVLRKERSDRRVRGPQDLADMLGLPVLGILPRPAFGRSAAPLSLMAQRVISGRLPQPKR